jgi:uncharacterized membrane protein YdjX (TVP38/TMEM64 family)
MNEDPKTAGDGADAGQTSASRQGTSSTFDIRDVKAVFRRLGPVGVLAAIAATLPAIGGFVLLGTMGWTGAWLKSHGDVGVGLFVLGFAVLAGLALLPTYAQSVLAGWTFGLATGSTAAMVGIAGAAAIGYFIARRASGDRVVDLIEEQPKWKAVYTGLLGRSSGKTLLIVTLLRVPHNSPFAISNLVLAACRVPLWIYLVGTVVGIAPRTVLAVFLGARASSSNFSVPEDRWLFILGVATALVVLGIIGAMANQVLKRFTPAAATDAAPSERPGQ